MKGLIIIGLLFLVLLSGCSQPISKTLVEKLYARECAEYLFDIELSDHPCDYACKKLCYEKGYEFNEASQSKVTVKGERLEGIFNKEGAQIEIEGYNCGCSCIKCKD